MPRPNRRPQRGQAAPPGIGQHLAGASYDPRRLLQVLHDHGVLFVIIGGIAGALHGSPTLTNDLDICYERSRPNLQVLADALRELHATLRGAPADLPFQIEPRTLELGDHFTFMTDAGSLDCQGTPSGTQGYPDLVRNAVSFELAGLSVAVAALDDLIRMKRAAGRPKDRVELEILGALRAELDQEDA